LAHLGVSGFRLIGLTMRSVVSARVGLPRGQLFSQELTLFGSVVSIALALGVKMFQVDFMRTMAFVGVVLRGLGPMG
jgi:hypothetical protein